MHFIILILSKELHFLSTRHIVPRRKLRVPLGSSRLRRCPVVDEPCAQLDKRPACDMSSVASPHIPPRSECIRPPSDAPRRDDHYNAPLSRHMLFSRWPGNTPFHKIQDAGHRYLNRCQIHRNGLCSADHVPFYPRQTPFITRRVEVPVSVTGPNCLRTSIPHSSPDLLYYYETTPGSLSDVSLYLVFGFYFCPDHV